MDFMCPRRLYLPLIEEIQERGQQLIAKGENPPWSDLQILRQLDAKEIGNALNASKYSMELVEGYLDNYKFRDWSTHSNGSPVTDVEKKKRAKEIALTLCSHAQWKTHSRGITRDVAWTECKIKVTHTESIENLDRAIRRFWAMLYWIFENTPIYKGFISDTYCVFRNDMDILRK